MVPLARPPHSLLLLIRAFAIGALVVTGACQSMGSRASSTATGGGNGSGTGGTGTGGTGGSGGSGGSVGGLDAAAPSDGAGAGGALGTGGAGGAPSNRDAGATTDAGTAATGGAAGPTDASRPDAAAPGAIATMLDIGNVWSGDPVGFALVTEGNRQFAAYYDAQQRMTVAARTLPATTWTFAQLPTSVGWDSHNSIAMAIDSGGFIHVSGNMHAVPLIYFRTARPYDITSFAAAPMVGSNEQSCTYPQFIHGPSGDFVYAYRDGVSGNGNYIFNVYDVPTKTWRRLINTPLTDGQGLRNAYPVGPYLGPDGWWHLVYVWRETPDASTNHDLSYARSRDLINWETGTGTPLTLPITLATSDIVDPVPVNGGIINNNTKVGFDAQNRPVVAYHKFDAAGNTQLYNARVENGRWTVHQTSQDWTYRWNIGGTGTLIFQIQLEGVKVLADGSLVQVWYHMQYGGWSAFRLDETTLASVATIGRLLPYPVALETVQSTTADMGVRWASDSGAGLDPEIIYLLRWETLPENQDQPRATIPPPTRLRLYGFTQ
jgi:BNR repeat-containing family member